MIMNIKKIIKTCMLVCISVLIAGCGSSPAATPTIDPLVLMTDVAGTIQAEFTQAALLNPSATIAPPPTATPLPIPTQPLPSAPTSPAGASGPAPVLPGESPDNATWIEDVETPDGTIFEPGDRFTRIWKIENTGTTIWNTGYRLIYYFGDPIMCDEADMNIYIQQSVDPNNQITLSVRMTAPVPHGTYVNHFRMINDKGEVFGDNLFIEIVVGTYEEKQAQENS
jgi:hypothetical protein